MFIPFWLKIHQILLESSPNPYISPVWGLSLGSFASQTELQKEKIEAGEEKEFHKDMPQHWLVQLMDVFDQVDIDKTGAVDLVELKHAGCHLSTGDKSNLGDQLFIPPIATTFRSWIMGEFTPTCSVELDSVRCAMQCVWCCSRVYWTFSKGYQPVYRIPIMYLDSPPFTVQLFR